MRFRRQDLGLMTQVSGEMSDHALICCAVRSRRGEVAEQRTELGLVIALRIRTLVKSRRSNKMICLAGEEPRLWGNWGSQSQHRIWDKRRLEEGKVGLGKDGFNLG